MANLDKASVRTEVSRLKADFEKLCAEGKLNCESQAIMTRLFRVVELILAILLERTTKKDTTHSSKPSSQTGKDESALGRAGSHGKGKADNKAAAQHRRTVETVTLSKALTCDVCGEDLTGVPCSHVVGVPRSIACSKQWLNTSMLRSNNVRPALPRSKVGFQPTCTGLCNMAMAEKLLWSIYWCAKGWP